MKKLVKFRLDNHWEGEGIIDHGAKPEDGNWSVTLTKPCKEFKAGTVILVGVEEITGVEMVA